MIGAGGLGSPVALYLGTAGVGRITLVDDDTVDLTNLQRQIAHDLARVGQPKAESARERDRARSIPTSRSCALVERADARAARRAGGRGRRGASTAATTSPPAMRSTRACVAHGKPLVAGAAIRFDGQISVYDTRDADVALLCLRVPARRRRSRSRAARRWACSRRWWASSARMQAAEALKLLAGIGSSLAGRLQMLDARTHGMDRDARSRAIRHCPVCARARPRRASAHS